MKYVRFLTIITLLSANPRLFARNNFIPNGAQVAIADEIVSHEKKLLKNRIIKKNQQIYSAPQGGAFFMIRFFQIVISPQDGPNCKYYPTCSNYGKQAVKKHGALLGSFLAGDRILRCNQYTHGRHDPVPSKILSK